MTSRERILTAMRGGQPDRVPISSYEINPWDPKAWQHSDLSYAEVLAAIRDYSDCIWMWGVPIPNAAVDDAATTSTEAEGAGTIATVRMGTPKGELVCRSRRLEGLETSWTVEPLVKDSEDIERWLSIPFTYEPPDLSSYFDAQALVGQEGIVQGDIADPICRVAELFDLQDFVVLAREDPARVRQILDIAQERLLIHLEHLLENTPVPAFRIVGPEYAAPPIMGPSAFGEFVVPYDIQIIELIHKYSRLARIHCHGKVGSVLDDIVRTGADALDPIEPPPFGDVTLREAKERYGDRMCLIGNIETDLLERGPEEDVGRAVRMCMDSAKTGGGYIICPTAMPICTPLPSKAARSIIRYLEEANALSSY